MSSPIPQPPRLPFLGNILDVDSNDPWGSFKRLADEYGPIYKIDALGKHVVVINNASLTEEVCDERRFRRCSTTEVMSELRRATNDALFTAYDNEPIWGIAHRIMAPSVAPSSDDMMIEDLHEMASELLAKWTSRFGERVNLTEDMKRLNVQSVIYHFFNQRYNLLNGEGPGVVELLDLATWETVDRPVRLRFLNWLYYDSVFDAYIKDFRKIAADFIASKRAEKPVKQDMLHALLFAKDPETGECLDDEKVIDEILTIIVTASSTAGLMSFALYYLLMNPDKIIQARQELDQVLGPGAKITVEDLAKLPYLEAVIRETLRLSATVPGFLLEPVPSDNPGEIVLLAGGKYQIPNNQRLMVLLAAVNRDPDVFEDPDAFRPERMLGEAYERLPAGVKKSFGNGKRYCLGKRFALQLSMITLATVLRSVDLQPVDEEYQLKQTGREICANFRAPVGFFVTVGPRNVVANGQ
ncbi:NADPH cytochrome P450 [Penicillium riverlandense]|uniref:NADPH cytochrome P450 n=1 Tax=Penicillium riverlandense TaxID=1903569 RepID=UPI002547223D|nr:NADPH cytochrome P450 [Penicillium riverlandense]KAJ5819055.1 NADPH cytochrome P450 [Penicillium riverlandense]